MLNINPDVTNVIMGKKTVCLYGKSFLEDELLGTRLQIAPKRFIRSMPDKQNSFIHWDLIMRISGEMKHCWTCIAESVRLV